jgi:Gas vesicle synthesis protein GvpL/GvpF
VTARKRRAKGGARADATYLYAVVASEGEPSASAAPDGLPGLGPLRWLALSEGLWLAAADAPLARYGAPAVEKGLKDLDWVSACAVAHERMVEHVASLGTAIPMKLFTLFSNDARAVADVARARTRLRTVVGRIAGRQEWGVRVSVDEATARTRARARAEKAAEGLSAGARFLTRRSQEHKEVRGIVDLGRRAADEVFEAVAGHADETRRRAPSAAEPGLRLLLDAAFLVPVKRAARFRESVRREAERLAPHGYRVVLTGPWPAYNFVAGAR